MATKKMDLTQPVTNSRLSPQSQSKLLDALWGSNVEGARTRARDNAAKPYMEYYAQQCDLFFIEQDTLASQGSGQSHIQSHQDLVGVAVKLINSLDDRATITNDLRSLVNGPPADDILANAINWAVRLVTMIELGELNCMFTYSRPLLWENDTLSDFVSGHFTPRKPSTGQVRLEKIFTAVNLERLAGISIEWTSDLASHLSLKDDDTKLLVFHHASFLRYSHTLEVLFPDDFCEETQRTLALLFPSSDRETQKWLRKHPNIDAGITKCNRLRADNRQIDKFYFWRERLLVLKQVFDESEPKTLSQFWHDRRKGPQWYTFWVAIVVLTITIFFGLIQCVEGALQVYSSW